MESQNTLLLASRFLVKEFVFDVVYFPVWWYSVGLKRFIVARWHGLVAFEASLGLTVWMVNWTRPMYGQYDIASRLISLLARTVVIIAKMILLAVHVVISLALVVVWLIAPLFFVYQLVYYVGIFN